MNIRSLIWVLAALAAFTLLCAPARAQSDNKSDLTTHLESWQTELERIENSLSEYGWDDGVLVRLRKELDGLNTNAEVLSSERRQALATAQSQLERLGPPPKEKEPPESEAAAKEREKLTSLVAKIDGTIRTAGVFQVRASQLGERIQDLRRSLFLNRLLLRSSSPLSGKLWRRVGEKSGTGWQSLKQLLQDWWTRAGDPAWLSFIFATGFMVWLLLKIAARPIFAHARPSDIENPTYLRRAESAARVMFVRAAPAVASAVTIYSLLWSFEMLPGRTDRLALAILGAFSLVVSVMALVRTMLSPRQPQWRIFPASDKNAKRLWWLSWGLAGIFGLDFVLAELGRQLVVPLPLTIAQSVFTTAGFVLFLTAMVATPLADQKSVGATQLSPIWQLIRIILWFLVIAIFASAILGYITLSRFLAAQVVVTGSIITLIYLLHLTIEEFANGLIAPETRVGRWATSQMEFTVPQQERTALLVSALLHALLLAIAVPLVLLQWGFDWPYVRTWLDHAFVGVQFGNWRISLGTVFLALFVFIAGIIITRLFQRWLGAGFLERGKFDKGARGAVLTAIGYLGFTIAALVAVSFLGLDFSNLAIIAGALGVGIGFGLQSIVNNFVSGLILLAERRINVGDWIIVGAEEGFVRSMSIRATEIETFDRNFVIIPNSELITQSVKNWMLRHRRARVLIDIGVSYDSDPDQVREIIMECARNHPQVTDIEKSGVWFKDFGDSALVFRLKTFVTDIDYLLDVRSDLRYDIFAAFRKAGIQIPYPQRDLHIKNIDRPDQALLEEPVQRPERRRSAKSARKPAPSKQGRGRTTKD